MSAFAKASLAVTIALLTALTYVLLSKPERKRKTKRIVKKRKMVKKRRMGILYDREVYRKIFRVGKSVK